MSWVIGWRLTGTVCNFYAPGWLTVTVKINIFSPLSGTKTRKKRYKNDKLNSGLAGRIRRAFLGVSLSVALYAIENLV